MKTDKEYPATHSMSTAWYFVDKDDNVAIFDIEDNGPIPTEASKSDSSISELCFDDPIVNTDGTKRLNFTDEQVELMLVGEAIRKARQAKSLSQEQLGEMVGVQKAQISRLENGKNLTIASICKLFKALDQQVSLDIPSIGRVALC